MIYKNIVTGAIIDSPCTISGGDWELEEKEIELVVEEDTTEKEVETVKKEKKSNKK